MIMRRIRAEKVSDVRPVLVENCVSDLNLKSEHGSSNPYRIDAIEVAYPAEVTGET
jgi:hypothetical protein